MCSTSNFCVSHQLAVSARARAVCVLILSILSMFYVISIPIPSSFSQINLSNDSILFEVFDENKLVSFVYCCYCGPQVCMYIHKRMRSGCIRANVWDMNVLEHMNIHWGLEYMLRGIKTEGMKGKTE